MAEILVVEDDRDSAESLVRFLTRHGHKATSAANGQEALAAVAVHAPDAVILDLRMPKFDGVSFLDVLRSYLRWSHMPVLVLTAYPEGIDAGRAEQLGVYRVLPKAMTSYDAILQHLNDMLADPADTTAGA